jgi:hypothetical protein
VTWQCFADGENGPIATKWQIDSYPRIFLIDHEGVIKHVFEGAPDPEQLDKLLIQMTKAASKPSKSSTTPKSTPPSGRKPK